MSFPTHAPRVIGQEQEDRLIMMDCPYCGVTEYRIHPGQNWCDVTDEPFLLVSIEYAEEK